MRFLILRDDLDSDVRVARLATILNLDPDHVVGKLWRFWRAAKRETASGLLPSWTPGHVDGAAECFGFAEALMRVGWLRPRCGGLEIPNFEEWMGPAAARAILSQVPPPRGDCPGFAEFWGGYPRKEGKAKALKAWNKLWPTGDLRRKIMDGLARAKASEQWARDRVIPHASTWLNGWRWEDEIDDAHRVGGSARVVAQASKYAGLGEGGPDPAAPPPG